MTRTDPRTGATDAPLELDLATLPPAGPEDRALGNAAAELGAASPSSPEGPAAPPALSEEEKKRLESKGMAVMLVEMGTSLAVRRWPVVTFTTEEKLQIADAAVPVLVKYDIGSAWLDKFKEELALGTVLFRVLMEKRAQVEAAEAAKKEKKPGPSSSSGPAEPEGPGGSVVLTALEGGVPDPLAAVRRS